MFRSQASDVIPERQELAGQILDEAYEEVEEELIETLNKQNVTMSYVWYAFLCEILLPDAYQPYLIELQKTNKDKKDAVSFCEAYKDMIDCTEVKYKCNVVVFTTDSDGGGVGHKLLVKKRLCCWCQLALGDYFKENKEAAGYSEDASELLGKSPELSEPLAYIMVNLTCWTTHFCSFDHLHDLEDPLQHATFLKHRDIIAAQVGAEKNNQRKEEMEDSVNKQCDLIMDNTFWNGLRSVVEDIEPICYAVNICQGNKVHPDQVLLVLGGLFLHFSCHTKPAVRDGMKKRLEKRWKSYDQEFFLFAMVLNPFEQLDQFGEAAKIGIWTLLEYFKKELKKWMDEVDCEELEQLQREGTEESGELDVDENSDMDVDESTSSTVQPVNRKWLLIALDDLFRGTPKQLLNDFIAPHTHH
ncbi:hypothetical protein D9758_013462 [Tetrapyrgos nigripes]|uniref:Uncharacterized protein n=1 Tax=Tetrapyrgos nigripes TaxID=182062 RepID=A0A8H5CRK2_9AGAR|nr:hypothetical protein D9758_013462 [Tetrapyrgos nigripes]